MCVAVALAGVSGVPALAAGLAAGATAGAQAAHLTTAKLTAPARPAAPYYSTDGDLLAVGTAAAGNAWAVGYQYTATGDKILMLHWNGKAWSRVTNLSVLNGTAGQLTAISVVSAADAWAVGDTTSAPGKAQTLLLHWNGKAWSKVASPSVSDAALTAVTATAKGGWAVGYYYTGQSAVDYFSLVFRLSGGKWSRVGTKLGGNTSLNGVAVTTAGTTWATGSVIGQLDGFLARWNGSTWVSASFPLAGAYQELAGVAAGPGGVAFAVGTNNNTLGPALAMKWTGKAWQKNTVDSPKGAQLNTVAFAPGGTAWAAGTTGFTGEKTIILRWNGKAWKQVATPGTGGLSGLAFAAAGNGWAVGSTELDSTSEKTLILHWNGKAWSSSAPTSTAPAPTTAYSAAGSLNGVAAASASSAWAVGYAGSSGAAKELMLHWNGSTWSRVTSPAVLTGAGELAAIAVVSAKDAWAVGYTGTLTTTASTRTLLLHWNGTAWSRVTSPAPVAGALTGLTATASGGWALGYVPNGHNFPNALAERLSGTTWSRVAINGGFEAVGAAITGAKSAWALGYNEQGSELRHWNGSKWGFAPSVLPDDLYLMPGITAGPGGTAFVVGVKESPTSGTTTPVSLRLTGSTWRTVTTHAPANGALAAVAYAPGGTAWTAGSTGASTLILRWNGAAWNRVASPSPSGGDDLRGLGFGAAASGWAVGSDGAKTLIEHWNGRAWS